MLRTPHNLARLVTTLYLRVPILPLFKLASNICIFFFFSCYKQHLLKSTGLRNQDLLL